jgi:transposase InsO family protein
MDIIGPMPAAQGNLKYVMVVVEYFTKWIEPRALATITSATIQKFFRQNIICCFGVPKSITIDNSTQFDSKAFRTLCSQVGTNMHFASVKHPESNGLMERVNGIILLGITKSLVGLPKGKWTEELVKVVWNHNTSISESTGFTLFKLLFGDELVTPKEIKLGSARVIASAQDQDNEKVSKDTIEESRLEGVEHIRKHQAETIEWRDMKVKLKSISPCHLVLRRVANLDTTGNVTPKILILGFIKVCQK